MKSTALIAPFAARALIVVLVLGCASDMLSAEPVPVSQKVEFTAEFSNLPKADVMPRPKFQARASYPTKFRGTGIEGEAIIHFIVNAKGDVLQAQCARATDIAFAEAAIQAVRKWVFIP